VNHVGVDVVCCRRSAMTTVSEAQWRRRGHRGGDASLRSQQPSIGRVVEVGRVGNMVSWLAMKTDGNGRKTS
jgi:hypothetical protein